MAYTAKVNILAEYLSTFIKFTSCWTLMGNTSFIDLTTHLIKNNFKLDNIL